MPARTLNLLLALWLFFSAFAWPRPAPTFTNAWVVGLLGATFAVMGMTTPKARFANTALSAWLLASAFVLPHRSTGSMWNDAVVAVAMFLFSLVPGTMYRRTFDRGPAHA
jgi:hypothetical protein